VDLDGGRCREEEMRGGISPLMIAVLPPDVVRGSWLA
jgi:hypothetical protein